jgi:hypothetical protein
MLNPIAEGRGNSFLCLTGKLKAANTGKIVRCYLHSGVGAGSSVYEKVGSLGVRIRVLFYCTLITQ